MAVAIVGGGISGLATAYYLSKAKVDFLLIEEAPRLGGVIRTESLDDCLLEGGPDSFLAQKPWARELIDELGMSDKIICSYDHQRKTYISLENRLIPIPEGFQFLAPTRALPILRSPLFSWRTKLKMAIELLRQPPREAPNPDRSVAEFVLDHFGDEVNEKLVQPMLSGVYGGSPERMRLASVVPRFAEIERKYGSVSRGLLRSAKPSGGPLFQSILGGMQQLTETLAGRIRTPITALATGLRRTQHGYEVHFGAQSAKADSVVLAIPAYRAGALLRSADADLADRLEAIPYSSSIVTGFAYRRDQLDHPTNGFGFLVPRSENRTLAACTWVHRKFPNRAPADRALLRAFIAGEKAEARMSHSDQQLAGDCEAELQQMMGYQGRAMSNRVFRWPRAMAQYETDHARNLDWIRGRLTQHPNLYLCGNAYEGIGIPDCVRLAKRTAERIAKNAK